MISPGKVDAAVGRAAVRHGLHAGGEGGHARHPSTRRLLARIRIIITIRLGPSPTRLHRLHRLPLREDPPRLLLVVDLDAHAEAQLVAQLVGRAEVLPSPRRGPLLVA